MFFANPQVLWLLLVFPPALLAFFYWSWRKRQQLMTQFIQARLLPGLVSGLSPARQKLRLAGLVLAVICLVLAMARPQWGFAWEEVKHRGLDIVVAVDTSKSMLAQDVPPNRLQRAKLAALDLMQQAKSDRLGLVAFAGSAFLQCPLTIDDTAFRQSVSALDVNTIPQGGTALADAIETSLAAFKEGDNYKVLVLFTDGEDQDSGAEEAAKKAAEAGLRIFTIGIGTVDGELLPVTDAQGHTDFIRDEHDNVHKSHLNEDLLRRIAGATKGGFYLPLRGAKTIDTLYEKGLAPLPKSESEEKLVKRYHEQYHWPLAIALALLAAEMLWPERRRQRQTSASAIAPGRPVASGAAALLILLLVLPPRLDASPASALREYKQGQYEQALKDYEALLSHKADDPRLRFNAGAAAYRTKQFDQAIKQFDEALAGPDLKLQQQTYYNRGNTYYYQGEANQDPSKQKEAWEKSLKDFDSTLKLDPQDADAKYNYQFVKKKLEELKQQQQQQKNQQDKSGDKQNQDQQQQQQDKQNQDSKKDQDQNSSKENKSGQKKDSSQQQQSNQQKEEDRKQKEAADRAQQQKEKEQQDASQQKQPQDAGRESKDKPDEKEGGEAAAAYPAGQMTPQQARQLLDAQKNEDMMLPAKPPEKPVDRSKPIRDW